MTEESIPDVQPAPPPTPEPFWSWGDFLLFLLLAFPCLLIASLLTRAALFLFHLESAPKGLQALPAEFLFYGMWLPTLALLFRMKYRAPFWKSLGWWYRPSSVFPSLLNGVSLAVAVGILGIFLKTPLVQSPMQELMRDRNTAIAIAVLAVTLGPVCEEVIFRGLLLPLLVRSAGAPAGIVLAALPFALLHGPQYGWVWQAVALVTLAGIGFGVVRHWTGSTAAAAITHAAYNGAFLLAWFQKSADF
ncbi:MAG TPA: type II CAAX endopeptidase family protein [Bryobacteraceae bacterium]|nr:type II CAAX endopeptidase family protein [Bryobacteraceae bacterium]